MPIVDEGWLRHLSSPLNSTTLSTCRICIIDSTMRYYLVDFDWKTTTKGCVATVAYYKHDVKDPEEKPIRLVFPGRCIPSQCIHGFVKEVQFNEKLIQVFKEGAA